MTDTFIDWKSERWVGLAAVTCALLLAACATTQRGIAGISGNAGKLARFSSVPDRLGSR
jgi:hypothetical protein